MPRPTSSLAMVTQPGHRISSSSTVEETAQVIASARGGLSPLVTMLPPRPLFVQPNQEPIILEPGEPPRLNTLVLLQSTITTDRSRLLESSAAAVEHDNMQYPAPTPAPDFAAFTFINEVITANSASQIVIKSQTLKPGGTITIEGTVLSLDIDASYVVINTTSTMSLGTGNPKPGDPIPRNEVTLVFGGTTVTQPNGHIDIFGDTTTIVPAHSNHHVKDPYTLVISGTTSTLQNGQITVLGGFTTIVSSSVAQFTAQITLSVGDMTSTLPDGRVALYGATETVIPAIVTPGAKSLTLTYGGRTVTRGHGRVSVEGGTVTVVKLSGVAMTAGGSGEGAGQSLDIGRGPTAQGDGVGGGGKGTSLVNGGGKITSVWKGVYVTSWVLVVVLGLMP
ncbi:hypothetical protein CC86DRAFT_409173 [Ophiobolus disseminans]|uniref:Uncharacterized protein n=1 Tax=Ophiobolus disseminans TaxID=1469910 RepID=A0A6A6ZQZ1_9PLEO|nr:hypothetical protein CC86DRAFT_409173 [Ophiobolus disseminans]